MIKIILITLAILVTSNANAYPPPASNENQQELMEIYKRNSHYCTLYRVKLADVSYIVNTCGGIVVEPKNIQDMLESLE